MNLIFLTPLSLTLMILIILGPSASMAAEPPLSVDDVARIFAYPAEHLKVEEVTDHVNRRAERRGAPKAVSVHTFSGTNNTFARFSIAVGDGGALLTQDMNRYAAEAIASGLANTNSPVKWLNLNDVGYGIAGLGMTGPGGSEERAVMTLFNNTDVQVTISMPGENPLQVLPTAEAYHDMINKQGAIRGKLIESLTTVASKVSGKPIQAALSDTPPAGAALPSPAVPAPKRPKAPSIQVEPENQMATVPVISPKTDRDAATKSSKPWWAVALLTVIALFTWRVIKRHR